MTTGAQKITLSSSRDIPFNKLVLSQSNVRKVKAGVSIEELSQDIARRGLLQGLNVRPVVDADGNETGMFEIPAGGRRYRALELLVKAIGAVFAKHLPWQIRRLYARQSAPQSLVTNPLRELIGSPAELHPDIRTQRWSRRAPSIRSRYRLDGFRWKQMAFIQRLRWAS